MSENQQCATCRYWVHEQGAVHDEYTNVRMCACPKMVHAGGFNADLTAMTAIDDSHVILGDEVGVVDGSGYYAKIFPAANYGCVHWTAKD